MSVHTVNSFRIITFTVCHPSIFFHLFNSSLQERLKPNVDVTGGAAGYTVDKLPIYHRANT